MPDLSSLGVLMGNIFFILGEEWRRLPRRMADQRGRLAVNNQSNALGLSLGEKNRNTCEGIRINTIGT